jgi:HEAT repeat protein
VLLAAVPIWAAEADNEVADAESVLKEGKVATDGPSLLEYFKKRTIPEVDRAKLAAMIRDLASEDFPVRRKAFRDLQAAGKAAVPLLRQAQKDEDPEVVSSATQLLEKIEAGSESALTMAAARVLAARKPAGSVKVLLAYLPLADDDNVQESLRNALVTLGVDKGKPDPAIVAALKDKSPARRATAAFVLGKAVADQRPAVRALFKDEDARVRYWAAFSLVQAGDKSGVETLIALLGKDPADLASQAEDVLYRLAAAAGDAAQETRTPADWSKWWKTNAAKIDLAKLNVERAYRGVTLMCEYSGSGQNGQGRIWEAGKDGKVRWEINAGLGGPLDARLLPNGNVLVGEYGSCRVTERDKKGNIVWQKTGLGNVCSCQRLPNGNTLIASMNSLMEVNKKGDAVFTLQGAAYYAKQLPNKHIIYTTNGAVVELNAARKEVARINLPAVNWGSVEKLANGRYLVALYSGSKVVEVDAKGTEFWSINVPSPTLAVRLNNGNTLVASPSSNTVFEYSRDKKEVWKQRGQGQPWRGRRY